MTILLFKVSKLSPENNNATSVLIKLQGITTNSKNQSLFGGDILIANSALQKITEISDELSIDLSNIIVSWYTVSKTIALFIKQLMIEKHQNYSLNLV